MKENYGLGVGLSSIEELVDDLTDDNTAEGEDAAGFNAHRMRPDSAARMRRKIHSATGTATPQTGRESKQTAIWSLIPSARPEK